MDKKEVKKGKESKSAPVEPKFVKKASLSLDEQGVEIIGLALAERVSTLERLASACSKERQHEAAKSIIAEMRVVRSLQGKLQSNFAEPVKA